MRDSRHFGGELMRRQEAFIRAHRDGRDIPQGRFEFVKGRKVRCVLCGRDGYGPVAYDPARTYPVRERGHRKLLTWIDDDLVQVEGPDTAPEPPRLMPWWAQFSRWQIDCLGDHPWPCSCGRQYRRFVDLWRHIGAVRPAGWGRQGIHVPDLECGVAS